tara:strand:- start:5470 stop:7653 length:2184 start_codon:yes stop_codon:yes gene_type:complete
MKDFYQKLSTILVINLLLFSSVVSSQELINFDGEVDPVEWKNAQRFELIYEVMPSRNTEAKHKTTSYVLSDSKFIYIGFIALMDPNLIRATQRNRDTAWWEDYVAVLLDPYGDGRYAILVGSNAVESQLDARQTSDGVEDSSYNIIFESKTQINQSGYTAEFKIPFSQLQYPNYDNHKWKIGFIRKTFVPGTETINADFKNLPRNQCFGCQIDKNIQFKKIESPRRRYLYPYITLNQTGNRNNDNFSLENPDHSIGLSGLYDISSTSTIEYTVNPDFSQVESDAPVIDINDTFAISYPEKRTFFLDGTELLRSDMQTIYTRSINDTQNALKYISQSKDASVYLLTATDSNSPYLAAGAYGSYLGNAGKSKINVLRYRRNLKNQSNIGIIATNRDYHLGGDGSVIELDGLLNLSENYVMDFNLAKSRTNEGFNNFLNTDDVFNNKTYAMDGEKFSGNASNLRLRRITDGYSTGVRIKQVSPNYRSHVGFVSKNSYKVRNYWQAKTFRSEGKFRLLRLNYNNRNTYDYRDQKIKEFYEYSIFFETDFDLKGKIERQIKPSEIFKEFRFNKQTETEMWMSYYPSEEWYFRLEYEYGDRVAYNANVPAIGDGKSYLMKGVFKYSDSIKLTLEHNYQEIVNKITNTNYFAGSIDRFITLYQPNNEISLKVILEKNEFRDDYFSEILFQWQPDPYTIFYAGGSQIYKENDPYDSIKVDSAQFYIKFQYFYQYQ